MGTPMKFCRGRRDKTEVHEFDEEALFRSL